MRGKGADHLRSEVCLGITPACAGKSLLARTSSACPWDHPRVCGEKRQNLGPHTARKGSPPRMRGKVNQYVHDELRLGITPACAGKRRQPVHRATPRQDHPRVCGEKLSGCVWLRVYGGSPPRMRGKVNRYPVQIPVNGITPAYAGKSAGMACNGQIRQDHPRVCGEKPVWPVPLPLPAGITPAYAGKRTTGKESKKRTRDHPRVCGEKKSLRWQPT